MASLLLLFCSVMSSPERKISAVSPEDPDRISGVDVRIATLENEAASLRAEVATLRDDIHWLSGAEEEEEELSWLARGWVRASLLLATVGAVAVASLPYLLHPASSDSAHVPVAETRPAPLTRPATLAQPAPLIQPTPVIQPTPLTQPAEVIQPARVIQPAPAIRPAPAPVPPRSATREPVRNPVRVQRAEVPEPARVVPAENPPLPAPQPRFANELSVPAPASALLVPAPSRPDNSP